MNITSKIQKEIFQQLLSSSPVQYAKTDDCIYATTDGIRAFRIDLKSICFNLDKCTEVPEIASHFKLTDQDKPLKVTNTMQQADRYIAVKLVSEDKSFSVWVNKKFLEEIGRFNLYGSGERNPVKLIYNATMRVGAILMPVRCTVEKE